MVFTERSEEQLTRQKESTPKLVRKNIKILQRKKLIMMDQKSKVKCLLEGTRAWEPDKRKNHLSKLKRNQVSTIFKARKNNFNQKT